MNLIFIFKIIKKGRREREKKGGRIDLELRIECFIKRWIYNRYIIFVFYEEYKSRRYIILCLFFSNLLDKIFYKLRVFIFLGLSCRGRKVFGCLYLYIYFYIIFGGRLYV